MQKENRKKEKIDMKLFQQSRAFYGGKPALLAQQSPAGGAKQSFSVQRGAARSSAEQSFAEGGYAQAGEAELHGGSALWYGRAVFKRKIEGTICP